MGTPNTFPFPLPQTSAPFVNPKTGSLSLAGLRFLEALWNRTGSAPGSNAATFLVSTNNLSDIQNEATARSNLGLANVLYANTAVSVTSVSIGGNVVLGAASLSFSGNQVVGPTSLSFSGTQVVGPRITGWGTPSGGSRSSGAAYAGQTIGSVYSQGAAQQTDNAVKTVSQQLMQLIADLKTHGLLGT